MLHGIRFLGIYCGGQCGLAIQFFTIEKLADFFHHHYRRGNRNYSEPLRKREWYGSEDTLQERCIHREHLEDYHNRSRPEQPFIGKEIHLEYRSALRATIPCVEPLEYCERCERDRPRF